MAPNQTPDSKTIRLQQELGSTYTIVERIGSGAMGEVYLANHKTLGGKWAIKVLADELAKDPAIVERFIREAQIEANLQHPNIVKVFDISTKGNFQFLVMPFVEGENLEERIKRISPMDPVEAVTIALHVTRALTCAHEHGIIHRDLKPANIRIDYYGTVVVMDFGIARVLDTSPGKTALGSRIGTPQYMSPEQSAGRPVDHRSDLYSLGVILYEMIAGENPFYTDNPFSIGIRHLTVMPPPLSTVRDDIKAGLSEIVDKLLAKDPSQRFQTAAEVREALSPFGGGVEIRTPVPLRKRSVKIQLEPESLLRLGELDAILHKILEPESSRDLSADEKIFMEFVDGVRNIRDVLKQIPLETEAAISALESLRNDGFVYTEIPVFAEELPATVLPPTRFSTEPARLPDQPTYPQVPKQATPRPEAAVQPADTAVATLVPHHIGWVISALLLVVLIAVSLWRFWPAPKPLEVQVDASPFAAVTVKSSEGEILAEQSTPFQILLPPGKYTLEFVSGRETHSEQVTISAKSSNMIRFDFWSAQKTERIRQLLEPYR